MKTVPSLLAASVAVSLGFAAAAPARAELSLSPQVQKDVKKLIGDLKNVAEHSDIDPDDVQTLQDDLEFFLASAAKPSTETIRKLATDAASALADGKLSTGEEFTILSDLNSVLQSAGFTDDQIQQIGSDIRAVVASASVTQADFQLVLSDLTALLADLQGNFVVTTRTIDLVAFALPRTSRFGGKPVRAEGADDKATIIDALRAAIGAQASVGIDTRSLANGTYKVNVVTFSTGAKTALGALEVNEAGNGAAAFGAGATPLPAGVDAADIASIEIVDDSDQPVLTGQTSSAKAVRAGSFPLSAAAASPKAKGDVTFQTKEKPKGAKSAFVLFAKKLPALTDLMLKVNGAEAGTVTTDKKGKLLIATRNAELPLKGDGVTPVTAVTPLPAGVDVGSIEAIELETLDGQPVAAGGFAN